MFGHNRSLTDAQQTELTEMMKDVHDFEAFECDGFLYRGNRTAYLKEYIYKNPSKKFNIWMADNYPETILVHERVG